MNDSFEDRLLAVLVEEVTSPSLPAADRGPALAEPSRSRAGRRVLVGAVGLAAALAIIGGILAAAGEDPQVVTVADQPTTTAVPRLPFLTFGAPSGEVRRLARTARQPTTHEFRRIGQRAGVVVTIQEVDLDPHAPGVIDAGTAGGYHLYELDLSSSGGTEMGVYVFEAAGRRWAVSASDPSDPASSRSDHRADVDALMSAVRFGSDGVTVAAPFEAFISLDRAPVAWTISDDRATAVGYADTTTDIADVPGTPVTVRGHAGKQDSYSTVWRESSGLIVRVSASVTAARTGRLDLPADDRLALAEALVPLTPDDYSGLRLLRGADVERVVVLPPAAGGAVPFLVTYEVDSPTHGATAWASAEVGPDGLALDLPDDAKDVFVWAATGKVTDAGRPGSNPPACAAHAAVPAAGAAAVELVVDPTCVG